MGFVSVLGLVYFTYLFLPVLVSIASEWVMKRDVGFTLMGFATALLATGEYRLPQGVLLSVAFSVAV